MDDPGLLRQVERLPSDTTTMLRVRHQFGHLGTTDGTTLCGPIGRIFNRSTTGIHATLMSECEICGCSQNRWSAGLFLEPSLGYLLMLVRVCHKWESYE
jgi:hypothetical protein